MNKFAIVTNSRKHYILVLLSGLVASIAIPTILSLFIYLNIYLLFALFVGLFFLCFFIAEKSSKQSVEFSITSTQLTIKWLVTAAFSKEDDYQILLNKVADYFYIPAKNFNLFKFRLKNGKTFRFMISHDDTEFPEFYEVFLNNIASLQPESDF